MTQQSETRRRLQKVNARMSIDYALSSKMEAISDVQFLRKQFRELKRVASKLFEKGVDMVEFSNRCEALRLKLEELGGE